MKRIEVHKYMTPLADNADCRWSLGIMNLTEAECLMIAEFANGARSINSDRARGLSATEMRGVAAARRDEFSKLYDDDPNLRDEIDRLRADAARSGVSMSYADAYEQKRAAMLRLAMPPDARKYDAEAAARQRAARMQERAEDDRYETAKQPRAEDDWYETAKQPEPDPEPGNRFSGLDIPDERIK